MTMTERVKIINGRWQPITPGGSVIRTPVHNMDGTGYATKQGATEALQAFADALESLRNFAVDHGEIQFAHLCTAAINGEMWAIDRLAAVLRMWDVACTMTPTTAMVDAIRSTDCTCPDGAVMRGGLVIE